MVQLHPLIKNSVFYQIKEQPTFQILKEYVHVCRIQSKCTSRHHYKKRETFLYMLNIVNHAVSYATHAVSYDYLYAKYQDNLAMLKKTRANIKQNLVHID
jgi:hypothetical protein